MTSTLSPYARQSMLLAETASIAKSRLQRLEAKERELNEVYAQLAEVGQQRDTALLDAAAKRDQLAELALAVINWQSLRDDAWSDHGNSDASWRAVEVAQDEVLELAHQADQQLNPRPPRPEPDEPEPERPSLDEWLEQHA